MKACITGVFCLLLNDLFLIFTCISIRLYSLFGHPPFKIDLQTFKLSLSETDWAKRKITLVEVDEAHHTPAKTWQQILINIEKAAHVLFTATPFRLDRKEIKGEIVYDYPLSIKELKAEQAALINVVKEINKKDIFNFLSDEGLLNNV